MPSFNRVFLLPSFSSSPRWGGFFFKRERAFVPWVVDTKGFATFRLRFPSLLNIWYQAKAWSIALVLLRWCVENDVFPTPQGQDLGQSHVGHAGTLSPYSWAPGLLQGTDLQFFEVARKVLIKGQREVPRLGQVVSRKTFKISHPSSRGKWALQMIFFFFARGLYLDTRFLFY